MIVDYLGTEIKVGDTIHYVSGGTSPHLTTAVVRAITVYGHMKITKQTLKWTPLGKVPAEWKGKLSYPKMCIVDPGKR